MKATATITAKPHPRGADASWVGSITPLHYWKELGKNQDILSFRFRYRHPFEQQEVTARLILTLDQATHEVSISLENLPPDYTQEEAEHLLQILCVAAFANELLRVLAVAQMEDA